MASLGGLVFLEELDMTGCRGASHENEKRIWQAIETRRARLPVPFAQLKLLRSTARRLQGRADEHPPEEEALRGRAARMLATIDRLVESGR